jgi:hypothetical protein
MAKKIIETFLDDLDGSEAARTTRFSIDDVSYEIDLSEENEDKLRRTLAPFIIGSSKLAGEPSIESMVAGAAVESLTSTFAMP